MLRNKQTDRLVTEILAKYCNRKNHSIKSDLHIIIGLFIFAIPSFISIIFVFWAIWVVMPVSMIAGLAYVFLNKHIRNDGELAKIDLQAILKEYGIDSK